MQLEWAQASRALPGQSLIGDAAWLRPNGDGFRLAVIDGLGHGREAAKATELALESLEAGPELALEEAFQALDRALAKSRGAALSLADLDLRQGRLRWGGVGNVEGVLIRAQDPSGSHERLLMQSGIVGYRLPPLRCRELSFAAGDLLLLHTDGIDSLVARDLDWRVPLQASVDALLNRHARPTDDALLWLGCFHG